MYMKLTEDACPTGKALNASEVNLEGMHLTSIDIILPLLGAMPNLRRLRLAHNKLHELPADMSELKQVEYIDLSGNRITHAADAIPGLSSIRTLVELRINTMDEDEEKALIAALPSLARFNDTPLNDNSTEDRSLDVFGSRTPTCRSSGEHKSDTAEAHHLVTTNRCEAADLASHDTRFVSTQNITPTHKTHHARQGRARSNASKSTSSSVTGVCSLVDAKLAIDDLPKWTTRDVHRAERLFAQVYNSGRTDKASQPRHAAFANCMNAVQDRMHKALVSSDAPSLQMSVEVVDRQGRYGQSRHDTPLRVGAHALKRVQSSASSVDAADRQKGHEEGLREKFRRSSSHRQDFAVADEALKARQVVFELCAAEVVKSASLCNTQLGSQLNELVSYVKELLSGYDTLQRAIRQDCEDNMQLMKRDIREAMSEIELLMARMTSSHPHDDQRCVRSDLSTNDSNSRRRHSSSSSVSESNDASTSGTRGRNAKDNRGLARTAHIACAKSSNPGNSDADERSLLARAHARPSTVDAVNGRACLSEMQATVPNGAFVCVPALPLASAVPRGGRFDAKNVRSAHGPSSKLSCDTRRHVTEQQHHAESTPAHSRVPSSGVERRISLGRLRDIIRALYSTKKSHDRYCRQTGQPRETMEQYLYTFLGRRYGLRDLVLESAVSIMETVKYYAARDIDVAIFGKILRNDIDEDFRSTRDELCSAVTQYLRVLFRMEQPSKMEDQLDELVQQRVHNSLPAHEWVQLVRFLYDSYDAEQLLALLHRISLSKKHPTQSTSLASLGDNRLHVDCSSAGVPDSTTTGVHRFAHSTSPQKHRAEGIRDCATRETNGARTTRTRHDADHINTAPSSLTASYTEEACDDISFAMFIDVLLHYQLDKHERVLAPLVSAFRRYDTDEDGVVDAEQGARIARALDSSLTDAQVDVLFSNMTCYASASVYYRMTFSDIKSCLQSVLIRLSELHR